jgi:hypothetical protein
MSQVVLESPVVVGDVSLAPTSELARVDTLDERIAVLARVAAALRGEDEIRDRIAATRDLDAGVPLPRRH